eukprot:scaffold45410_cov20-Tisochrysis_lutea.AAC.1
MSVGHHRRPNANPCAPPFSLPRPSFTPPRSGRTPCCSLPEAAHAQARAVFAEAPAGGLGAGPLLSGMALQLAPVMQRNHTHTKTPCWHLTAANTVSDVIHPFVFEELAAYVHKHFRMQAQVRGRALTLALMTDVILEWHNTAWLPLAHVVLTCPVLQSRLHHKVFAGGWPADILMEKLTCS